VKEGLSLFGEKDNARGRRRLVEELDSIAREEGKESGTRNNPGEQTLQSALRRGWYWGSQEFRERLITEFGGKLAVESDRELKSSGLYRDHGEKAAGGILGKAEEHFGATVGELAEGGYGDLRRVAVAWAIARHTTMRQKEIAVALGLRTAANVSQRVKRFDEIEETQLDREIRGWKKKMSKFVC